MEVGIKELFDWSREREWEASHTSGHQIQPFSLVTTACRKQSKKNYSIEICITRIWWCWNVINQSSKCYECAFISMFIWSGWIWIDAVWFCAYVFHSIPRSKSLNAMDLSAMKFLKFSLKRNATFYLLSLKSILKRRWKRREEKRIGVLICVIHNFNCNCTQFTGIFIHIQVCS